jgi:hypothetical protein
MTITSKAALAKHLGVSKPRVSQYIERGMPVRDDGKLDLETCVKWIGENFRQGVKFKDRGAERARTLNSPERSPRVDATKEVDATDPLAGEPWRTPVKGRVLADEHPAVAALADLLGQAGPCIADATLAAGCGIRAAYALELIVGQALTDFAEKFLAERRIMDVHADYSFGEYIDDTGRMQEADFAALSARAGEPFDVCDCERFYDAVKGVNRPC